MTACSRQHQIFITPVSPSLFRPPDTAGIMANEIALGKPREVYRGLGVARLNWLNHKPTKMQEQITT
jgi:hypothetical protein